MPLIAAHNLRKNYGDLAVLKEVSFEIQKGEIIAIVGASGAGKSTLLNIIGTLDTADAGDLLYNNKKIDYTNSKHLAAFRNQNIGFVFQFHHLLPEFTAIENIILPALINGTTEKKAIEKAMLLLEKMQLNNRGNHKPAQLSGGEQQRVAIARALINGPTLILADEPSGNLDSANAKALHQLIFDLRDQFNQTFIIITHNEELASMTDKKMILKDGILT